MGLGDNHMRLFYRPRWNEVYQINASMGAIRFLMGLLFWLWGICGFALVAVQTSEVFNKLKDGVGVGSSSFWQP